MWRDEIYERAPDFKAKVAAARFRSAEWRFLAALDGERSAGDIARALGYDEAAAASFVAAQETNGTIVASLLSFEQFEKVAGPLLGADAIARDFPEAGLAALRESETPDAQAKAPRTSDEPVRERSVENSASASNSATPSAGGKVDTSIGAALEGLRKLRARAAEANAANAAAASAPEPAPAIVPAAPAALAPDAKEPLALVPIPSAPVAELGELDEARASLVDSLAHPEPAPETERAIVHRSATVIPLASMLERVQRPEKLDAEAAAWNAVLERMRESGSSGSPANGAPANANGATPPVSGAAPADAASPDSLPPPRNVRRLPFGKRPEV